MTERASADIIPFPTPTKAAPTPEVATARRLLGRKRALTEGRKADLYPRALAGGLPGRRISVRHGGRAPAIHPEGEALAEPHPNRRPWFGSPGGPPSKSRSVTTVPLALQGRPHQSRGGGRLAPA